MKRKVIGSGLVIDEKKYHKPLTDILQRVLEKEKQTNKTTHSTYYVWSIVSMFSKRYSCLILTRSYYIDLFSGFLHEGRREWDV